MSIVFKDKVIIKQEEIIMPDSWTHILGANEIIEDIKKEKYKSILMNNIKYFNLDHKGQIYFFIIVH